MRTKRRLSVTIDADLLKAVDEASKNYHMAKSHLAQEAFELWLKKKTEQLMAKGYREMTEEDKELAELSFDAQREIVS